MKKLIVSAIVLFMGSVSMAAKQTYEVTIQNLTKGQPITPVMLVAHNAQFKMYELGEKASEGLEIQAKDGGLNVLTQELEGNPNVMAIFKGSGVAMPGKMVTLNIEAAPESLLSLTSMLARTNDAFVGGQNLILPSQDSQSVTYYLGVYDAGAEINTESCEHVPAPPCDSHNVGPEGEGFVHAHPGIVGVGDLDLLRDTFGKIAAKVTIVKK